MTPTHRSRRTWLYRHLVAVGISWSDKRTHFRKPTLWSVDFARLVSERSIRETETRFDGITLTGAISGQLPHPFITWPIYQRIRRDSYWRTQIDGDGDGPCLFQIPYINIHLSIDRYINGRTKRTEGQVSRTADIRTHYLTDLSTERQIPLLMETIQGVTGTGCVYFQSETSIFTYWLIDQSIYLSTDRRIPLSTDTNRGLKGTGRIHFQSETSIFTYW